MAGSTEANTQLAALRAEVAARPDDVPLLNRLALAIHRATWDAYWAILVDKKSDAEAEKAIFAYQRRILKAGLGEARAVLARARSRAPENTVVLTNLGAVLADDNRFTQALKVLRQAEALGSDDANLYFNIGVAMMNLAAERSHARAYFARASELTPGDTIEAYIDFHGH